MMVPQRKSQGLLSSFSTFFEVARNATRNSSGVPGRGLRACVGAHAPKTARAVNCRGVVFPWKAAWLRRAKRTSQPPLGHSRGCPGSRYQTGAWKPSDSPAEKRMTAAQGGACLAMLAAPHRQVPVPSPNVSWAGPKGPATAAPPWLPADAAPGAVKTSLCARQDQPLCCGGLGRGGGGSRAGWCIVGSLRRFFLLRVPALFPSLLLRRCSRLGGRGRLVLVFGAGLGALLLGSLGVRGGAAVSAAVCAGVFLMGGFICGGKAREEKGWGTGRRRGPRRSHVLSCAPLACRPRSAATLRLHASR